MCIFICISGVHGEGLKNGQGTKNATFLIVDDEEGAVWGCFFEEGDGVEIMEK